MAPRTIELDGKTIVEANGGWRWLRNGRPPVQVLNAILRLDRVLYDRERQLGYTIERDGIGDVSDALIPDQAPAAALERPSALLGADLSQPTDDAEADQVFWATVACVVRSIVAATQLALPEGIWPVVARGLSDWQSLKHSAVCGFRFAPQPMSRMPAMPPKPMTGP